MLGNRWVSGAVLVAVVVLSVDLATRVLGMQGVGPASSRAMESYIKDHPEVIIESLESMHVKKVNERRAHATKALSANKERLVRASDAKIGSATPAIQIIEFLDFSCGYSRKFLPIKQKLIQEYPDVQFIIKELPMFGEKSMMSARASRAAYALSPTTYASFHQELLAIKSGAETEGTYTDIAAKVGMDTKAFKKEMLDTKKYDDYISDNVKIAMEVGIEGTPAFIIGDELIGGFLDYEGFKSKINALKDARKLQ
jgi:protein-disulfide isomerase